MLVKDFLFNKKLPLMNKALDAYALRQQTTAKNIANADTPNYRPERVRFEELFHNEEIVLKGSETEKGHIPLGANISGPPSGEKENRNIPEAEIFFSGDNHVNIDREMAESAENQIRFRLVSKMVGKYFNGISNSIKGTNT
ncbi:flagellar basal body rod protein FlgB [bacterium]|nr:MAG: flagellar basal body rod protein FlgB [bacterium]